jgi:predicted amidohydrolase
VQNETLISQQKWEALNAAYAHLLGVYMVYVNRVGVEDGIQFWGGSHVFAPGGTLVGSAKILEPELKVLEIDLAQISRSREALPLLRDEKIDWTIAQLQAIRSSRP